MIGVEPARTAWGGSTREFAAALRAKTGRYEFAGRPYVIALGNTHMFQSADDPLDVLYGQVAIEIIGGPNRDWRRARYESRTGCSAQTEIAASQPYYISPSSGLGRSLPPSQSSGGTRSRSTRYRFICAGLQRSLWLASSSDAGRQSNRCVSS